MNAGSGHADSVFWEMVLKNLFLDPSLVPTELHETDLKVYLQFLTFTTQAECSDIVVTCTYLMR